MKDVFAPRDSKQSTAEAGAVDDLRSKQSRDSGTRDGLSHNAVADHPLNIRILPRRPRGANDFFNPETFNPSAKALTINCIAVTQQIARWWVKGKRLYKLLCCPLRCRVLRYIKMNNLALIMFDYNEHIQHSKCCCRYGEKIN